MFKKTETKEEPPVSWLSQNRGEGFLNPGQTYRVARADKWSSCKKVTARRRKNPPSHEKCRPSEKGKRGFAWARSLQKNVGESAEAVAKKKVNPGEGEKGLLSKRQNMPAQPKGGYGIERKG